MVQLTQPIPPATQMPAALGTAAVGTSLRYAREDHAHASPPTPPGQQAIRVQTNASGAYTWTYPTPFGVGVVPIISVVAEAGVIADILNAYIVGAPTNTQCVIQVSRTAATVVALLGLTILSIPASVGVQWIHITARAP